MVGNTAAPNSDSIYGVSIISSEKRLMEPSLTKKQPARGDFMPRKPLNEHEYLGLLFTTSPSANSVEDFESLLPWNIDRDKLVNCAYA